MLEKWKNHNFEDTSFGSTISDDFKLFSRDFRRCLSDDLAKYNIKIHSFSLGHHYFFLTVTKGNKCIYVSIQDVRWNDWNDILYRTMKHSKDWTGGQNHYSNVENLSENINNLFKTEF